MTREQHVTSLCLLMAPQRCLLALKRIAANSETDLKGTGQRGCVEWTGHYFLFVESGICCTACL